MGAAVPTCSSASSSFPLLAFPQITRPSGLPQITLTSGILQDAQLLRGLGADREHTHFPCTKTEVWEDSPSRVMTPEGALLAAMMRWERGWFLDAEGARGGQDLESWMWGHFIQMGHSQSLLPPPSQVGTPENQADSSSKPCSVFLRSTGWIQKVGTDLL